MTPPRGPGYDPERHAGALVPAGIAAIVAGIAMASVPGLFTLLIGLALLGISCVSRTDGFLLTGPFVGVELRRSVRRTRHHLWWPLTAGVAGACVLAGYGIVVWRDDPRAHVASRASVIFLFFAWNFFLMVMSIVLTLMAYCIAEDRDGKRLDFLLASDLRSREIVVGKVLGRLLVGVSYVIVLLPVVVLLPALFGIEPLLIVTLTVVSGLTLFSMAGLSVLSSTLAATKKTGGTAMVMFVAPYLLASFALNALADLPEVWFFPGTASVPASYSVADFARLVGVGNPILMFRQWAGSFTGGPNFAVILRDLPGYAAFHIGAGLVGVAMAVRLLRSRSAKLADRPKDTKGDDKRVPEVSDRPVEWKERYFTKGVVQARRKKIWKLVSFAILGMPLVLFIAAAVSDLGGRAQKVSEIALVYPPLLVWVFSVAGSRFGLEALVRERDKDTLTMLLLTDIPPRRIVAQKFAGILRILLPAWLAVAAVTAASFACGGVTLIGGLGLVVMVVVFGVFFVALGLHSSAKGTSLESASKTFGLKMAPAAIIPPICIMLTIIGKTFPADDAEIAAMIVAGLIAVYAVGAYVIYRLAVKRFVQSCDPAAEQGPLLGSKDGAATT